jgi:endonuclease YncB( thermonuclease family)
LETRWDRELLAPADGWGQRLNAALVRQGEAQVATVPPHVKDQERGLRLQGEAREAKRGLWGTK